MKRALSLLLVVGFFTVSFDFGSLNFGNLNKPQGNGGITTLGYHELPPFIGIN